jgi:phospholipid/cholesterol/gamma-HCH transport system permease protein
LIKSKYMSHFITIMPSTDLTIIQVKGNWDLSHLADIYGEIHKINVSHGAHIEADIDTLDTAGAMALLDVVRASGVSLEDVQNLHPEQLSLLQLIAQTKSIEPETVKPDGILVGVLVACGQKAVMAGNGILDLLRFVGEVVATLGYVITHPKRIRVTSIVRHIHETGLAAIPIVALIAFLISVVLAYQGASQLQRFGAEIFTINMVAVSVLREMGVLLTAIMVAGRSGSAFTAEIGVMKVNEEVDAMRIVGVNPFEILVLPRMIALIITLPLLTFVADIMGLIGGGLISNSLLNIGYDQYLDRFKDAVSMNDFWVGMVKAPVFAFFIAAVGCMRGLQVSGSAESIGRLTTIAVVQSIFLVLLLDALFSILFTKLGI